MIKAASASSSTLGIKNTFRRSAQHHLLVCRFVCNSLIDYGRNGLGKGPAGKYSIPTTSTNECEKGCPAGGPFCILSVWWGANPRSGFTLWQDSQSGRTKCARRARARDGPSPSPPPKDDRPSPTTARLPDHLLPGVHCHPGNAPNSLRGSYPARP